MALKYLETYYRIFLNIQNILDLISCYSGSIFLYIMVGMMSDLADSCFILWNSKVVSQEADFLFFLAVMVYDLCKSRKSWTREVGKKLGIHLCKWLASFTEN